MIRIFVGYDGEEEENTAIKVSEIIRKHDDISAVFVKVIQSNEEDTTILPYTLYNIKF